MLFWSKIEYLGIFSFPTLFLLFVFDYTGKNKWITRRNIMLLFIIPTILLLAKFSDDYLHLVYATAWVDTSGLIPLMGFSRGPIYPFALYSCIPVSVGVILTLQKRQNTPKLYRNQATLIAISAMLPLLVLIIYMFGFVPFPNLKYLDLNAFVFTLSGIGVGWAMFRYKLFDLAPIARDTLIEHLRDGVFVLDEMGRLVDANPAGIKFLGMGQLPIGQDAGTVFSSWKELQAVLQAPDPPDAVTLEIENEMDGDPVFFETSLTLLKDRLGRNFGRLIVVHEITERRQLEEELRELSLLDELTGLSNRRGFYLLATQFMQMAKRMDLNAAIIFADMDGMKKINDTFGHGEGDQALIEFSNIMRGASRSSDILARLGGDEFVILGIETRENLKDVLLSRLTGQLEAFNHQGGRKYTISASFGVAHFFPGQFIEIDELVKEADKAMYEQKLAKKLARPSD